MGFLDRFLKKQKKERLEQYHKKEQKVLNLKKIKKEAQKKAKMPGYKIKAKFKIDHYNLLIQPLITEKASGGAAEGKYAFIVGKTANKIMIKKAVNSLYDVKVKNVRIVNVKGKPVRYGRSYGRTQDWKKAIVTLAPGEKIEVYEGV